MSFSSDSYNRTDNSGNGNNNGLKALRTKIQNLDFPAFQMLVVLWLGAKGYRHMLSLGRAHARGRRRVGGADFLAQDPNNGSERVAIQLRHWQTPVSRRAVDELRGFMLRQEITHGLIISTSEFSRMAVKAALAAPERPIRLVSASSLAGSMAALGLGIEPDLSPNAQFFRSLDGLRFGSNRLAGTTSLLSPKDPDAGPGLNLWLLGAAVIMTIVIFLRRKLGGAR